MNNLIYYPTFEPQSETWLKYAVMHIENFSPIIPVRGKKRVSRVFKKIEDETNLIRSIEPQWYHGVDATTRALSEISLIKSNPGFYERIFKNDNIVDFWERKDNWTETLYNEKYNDAFKDYCLKNKLGEENGDGLLVSESLANLYMTLLAETISFENSASPITDITQLDLLSTYLRTRDVDIDNTLDAAQIVLQSFLPTNIENIKIDRFIEFRRNSEISEVRSSFNNSLQAFYEAVEQNFDPYSYIESVRKTNGDFIRETALFFGSVVSFTLGGLIILNDSNTTTLEVVKQIVEGSLLTVGGVVGVNRAWKLNEERRNARKFLSEVRQVI